MPTSASGRSAALDILLDLHPDIAFVADVSGSSARVDLIRVPTRRSGLGSLVYRSWEAGLAPGTEIAVDPVDDIAEAFWRSLGFRTTASGRMTRMLPARSGKCGPDAS